MFIDKITKDIFMSTKKDLKDVGFGRMKKDGYGKVVCAKENSNLYFLFMGDVYVRTPSWRTNKIDLSENVEYSKFLSKLKQNLIWMGLDI